MTSLFYSTLNTAFDRGRPPSNLIVSHNAVMIPNALSIAMMFLQFPTHESELNQLGWLYATIMLSGHFSRAAPPWTLIACLPQHQKLCHLEVPALSTSGQGCVAL